MKPNFYTIGTDNGSKQTFSSPAEAISTMNEKPNQQLEDIFGYDEDGEEIVEGQVEIDKDGKFYLENISYI